MKCRNKKKKKVVEKLLQNYGCYEILFFKLLLQQETYEYNRRLLFSSFKEHEKKKIANMKTRAMNKAITWPPWVCINGTK